MSTNITSQNVTELIQFAISSIAKLLDNVIANHVYDTIIENDFETIEDIMSDISNYDECYIIIFTTKKIDNSKTTWDENQKQLLYKILLNIFKHKITNFDMLSQRIQSHSSDNNIDIMEQQNINDLIKIAEKIVNDINKSSKNKIDINIIHKLFSANNINHTRFQKMNITEFSDIAKQCTIKAETARNIYDQLQQHVDDNTDNKTEIKTDNDGIDIDDILNDIDEKVKNNLNNAINARDINETRFFLNEEDTKENDSNTLSDYTQRKTWIKGSRCEIYSRHMKNWCKGTITNITKDNEGEWLVVIYEVGKKKMEKEIDRFSKDIRHPLLRLQSKLRTTLSKLVINRTESKFVVKHEEKNMNKTLNPKNPLVVLLPISEYFNNFDSLPGIKYDTIANCRFWSGSLGYEVFPSREDDRWYGKMFWTETEITQYFDNIIDTKLLDENRQLLHVFDAVIIIISCHGGQSDVIYSSDEKSINLHNIYNQFGSGKYTKNNCALIEIPRVFIIGACRGSYIPPTVTFSTARAIATDSDNYNQYNNNFYHRGSNRVTLFGNSPGIAVKEMYDGDIEHDGCGNFIRSIISVLRTKTNTCTISELLEHVKKELSDISDNQQIPYKNGDIDMDKLQLKWQRKVEDEKYEEQSDLLLHKRGDIITFKNSKHLMFAQITTVDKDIKNQYEVDLTNISKHRKQKISKFVTTVQYKVGQTPRRFERYQAKVTKILDKVCIHSYEIITDVNQDIVSMDGIVGTPLCIRNDIKRNWMQITVENASKYHEMLIYKPRFHEMSGQTFMFPTIDSIRSYNYIHEDNKMVYGVSTSSKWQYHDFDVDDVIYVSPNSAITFYVH
eukprot:467309_1